jgi:hypothetical protein
MCTVFGGEDAKERYCLKGLRIFEMTLQLVLVEMYGSLGRFVSLRMGTSGGPS